MLVALLVALLIVAAIVIVALFYAACACMYGEARSQNACNWRFVSVDVRASSHNPPMAPGTKSMRQAWRVAAADEAGQRVREQACDALAAAFGSCGKLLWVTGYTIGRDRISGESPFGLGSDARVGLATVLQIAAELVRGACMLLRADNAYGAQALVRQLVEVEYLAWAFAEDSEESSRWMRSTREERLKKWRPVRMRQRAGGRFRDADYAGHCDRGGHPTPTASMLLPDHSVGDNLGGLWWFDLASHSASIRAYIQQADAQHQYPIGVQELPEMKRAAGAVAAWRRDDPVYPLMRARAASSAP